MRVVDFGLISRRAQQLSLLTARVCVCVASRANATNSDLSRVRSYESRPTRRSVACASHTCAHTCTTLHSRVVRSSHSCARRRQAARLQRATSCQPIGLIISQSSSSGGSSNSKSRTRLNGDASIKPAPLPTFERANINRSGPHASATQPSLCEHRTTVRVVTLSGRFFFCRGV